MLGKLDHEAIQGKWNAEWERSRVYEFDAKSKKPIYSIDSPPPFTSGALHMGHMLSYAYFDFAARYKRMHGYAVYYPQGWDCQGFPTEVKVRAKHANASRDEFLRFAHEFTEANIAKMRFQMRAMGFSPDWKHEYKTMSDDYHRRVQYSLLRMFNDGLIYRAKHPVLWCPKCASAIAKAETEEKPRETRLNFVRFRVAVASPKAKTQFRAGERVVIATTRPEFLHACVAVAVHPEDLRFAQLVGAELEVPLFKQRVRVIADRDVDKDFGTGIVMICTFGDRQDVVWAYRLNLRVVEALDERGRLINAGEYDGMKAKDAREKILEALREHELFEHDAPLAQNVKVHDRCGTEAEFLPSFQWFIKLKNAGDDVVAAGKKMRWIPSFTLQYLVDWAEGLEWDWVISRQNVFGTPLPFWYCEKCGEIVAADEKKIPVDPANEKQKPHAGKCLKCGGALVGEQSVCDCWVDSSITPLVIAKWPDDEAFFKKVYPATLRPQGLEIIRTWAFYTIFRCLKLTGQPPFRELLINGSVLGTDGKKMSKSAGNFEDPEALLKKYPADALRQWAALSGAFAKDRPFSYKDVDFAKSFLTKLWNAARFVESATQDFDKRTKPKKLELVDQWLLARTDACVAQCTAALEEYDYFAAINAIHQFFWRDFCDYYLEDVKHRIYAEGGAAGGASADSKSRESRAAAQYALRASLEKTLLLLAPFACYTTDEIYSQLYAKNEAAKGGASVHAQAWPTADFPVDERVEQIVGALHFVLSEIRKFKASNALALNAPLASVTVRASEERARDLADVFDEIKAIAKVGNVVVAELREDDSKNSEGLIVECSK